MLCDKERGDAILTEEYSFSTALETAWPLGIHVFGARMDAEGLLPESMDEILSSGIRLPGLATTSRPLHGTLGTEPHWRDTGRTEAEGHLRGVPEARRLHHRGRAVLLPPDAAILGDRRRRGPPPPPPWISSSDSLIPSLLSMDVDGRVLRMDSFSKIAVPGSRLGWVTGSDQIIERYIRHAEVASQGPSGISQVIMHKLVDEEWGHEGFFKWLMSPPAAVHEAPGYHDGCMR